MSSKWKVHPRNKYSLRTKEGWGLKIKEMTEYKSWPKRREEEINWYRGTEKERKKKFKVTEFQQQ